VDAVTRDVLFFINIPKAAGTTIRAMLRRNLRSRLMKVSHVFFEGAISGASIRQWLNHDTTKLGVASHCLSLDLHLEDCETFLALPL
jgi:hypothetical protein